MATMKIVCKMCGAPKVARLTKGQCAPRYCSRRCRDSDLEFKRAAIKTMIRIQQSDEGRQRVSEQLTRRYLDPNERRITGEKSRLSQGKAEHVVLCACGCGENVVYFASPRKVKCIPRYRVGHVQRTAAWKELRRKQISEEYKDPARVAQRRQATLAMYARGVFRQSGPEKMVAAILTNLGVHFTAQWTHGPYAFDFHLTVLNKVIEVHGDYFHANPAIYPNGPINKVQSNRIRIDKSKSSFLRNRRIQLLVIWEHNLKHDNAGCVAIIKAFT